MAGLKRQSSKAKSVETETVVDKENSPITAELSEQLSSTQVTIIKDEATESATSSPSLEPTKIKNSRSSSSSTNVSKDVSNTLILKNKVDDVNGHATPKMDQELQPSTKANRSASSKSIPRIAPLFDHLPDASDEAKSSFSMMETCTYSNKYLGYTEHAMECDCSEEWDAATETNAACGEDSDCINRATKMECIGDCGCGSACQNQRFQQREYADVSVIKTEKKGYGLRTNSDLKPGDFIFEYIGEVINEPQFRRRMLAYDDQGIKHFYFMSLTKGEFVDATKKGNLARFCNHSCNPNCYVDKWVVGDKLRMGIFAEKSIKTGEELVFDYNVDRYGANPQPCYCGEANCTGFIGGKTQTERATKLSAATIEALGIEDADSWDTAVAKRPRKKKAGEDDEEYVDSVEAKSLEADGVTKVMAALMQCKEKWIAVKLLQRIQRCEDEQVRNRVVKLHGYQILNSQLAAWKDDENVVLQILEILDKFPRITRNKIIDSKIEATLQPFTENQDERVASQAGSLLKSWAKLEVAYRIPRKKRDPNETSTLLKVESNRFERRESSHHERKRSRSRSRTPPRGPSSSSAPSGPRSSLPQRSNNFFPPRPSPFIRNFGPLPRGWFQTQDQNGKTYYYSSSGQTMWQRPTQSAEQPPPPPPKQPSNQDVLKSIIDNIVTAKEKERETKNSTPDTPKEPKKEKRERKEEKWKSYDEDKKKKIYENTLFPHISHVMNKYKSKIPKDDLKRFAKDISKKLSASDFKAGRVKDPTKLEEKHVQKVKKYCKDFFDKAAHKHTKHEQEKLARKSKSTNGNQANSTHLGVSPLPAKIEASADAEVKKEEDSDDEDGKMSEDEHYDDEEDTSPSDIKHESTNGDTSLKRKRQPADDENDIKDEDEDFTKSPMKKVNLSEIESPPPPPPPPAPPAETPSQETSPADLYQDTDTDIHAETSFKSKSMADVLAEAQQDDDEGMGLEGPNTADASMEAADATFMEGVTKSEMHEMENPLIEGQKEAVAHAA